MLNSALAYLAVVPLELLAQAGGGGSFGSGGSSSGGGGSGGYGGGDSGLGSLLVELTIRHPLIGIPVWIAIAIFLYQGQKGGRNYHVTRTIRRGRKFQEEHLRNSVIGQIQQRDPDFEQETFLQRVANGFLTIQQAWSEQDLRRCRAFISDGVRERFELYIAMQQAEGIRNRLRNFSVVNSEIVSVTTDRHFDSIHVRITASAISYNEDLKTGRRVSGNSDTIPITFTEIWSFSRMPGVKTNPEASIMQGRCPNCGGPVDIVDKAECSQCQSIVNSGQYDWVLAEITQDEEWIVPPAQHSVTGWNELQQQDPGLNFQHIEDRASVIFWRSMMAVYFDDFSYASPVLDSQTSSVPALWTQGQNGFWKTPAVGAVEVLKCIPAQDDDFDRILVLVRWSAIKSTGDRKNPRLLGVQRIYSHVLTLKRQKGTQTKSDQAFSSFSCPGCGAPIDVGGAKACVFCGSPLNDGTGDWVPEDVGPHNMINEYLREDRHDNIIEEHGGVERLEADRFLNEPELLTALSRILTVDGELHKKERQHIIDLAERRGVPKERLKAIFATATSQDIPITLPQNRVQANVFMDHLLRAALVDGKVTRSEERLLLQASEQIGWTSADLKIALARVRRELFQQAKSIIRELRKR
jgi:uncharacterized tellurite resistance protein B-like protein/predicted RNA-binding Zn-ribbon protein involved in translation (DUF1610 family)